MAFTRKEEPRVRETGADFSFTRPGESAQTRIGHCIRVKRDCYIGGLVIPLFTKNVVDNFSIILAELGQISGMAFAFIASAVVASGVSVYLLNYAGQRVVAGIRDRLWKKLLVLPVRYYDNSSNRGYHLPDDERYRDY